MRKITQMACDAFINGRDFTLGNTHVYHDSKSGMTRMLLHGNLIAEQGHCKLIVSLAGWPTPTTRERVNGLLDSLNVNRRFYQRDHAQYFGSTIDDSEQEIAADEWLTV
jgi:hypothetical protein